MFAQQIKDLAASISKGGFRWVEDGPTIRKIVQYVDTNSKTFGLSLDVRRETAVKVLDVLDTLYGWDAPRMTDEQERAFYKYIVQMEILA